MQSLLNICFFFCSTIWYVCILLPSTPIQFLMNGSVDILHSFIPSKYADVEHCSPLQSRHVANGEILGVTLLMEDVLQTGYQDVLFSKEGEEESSGKKSLSRTSSSSVEFHRSISSGNILVCFCVWFQLSKWR